MAVDSSPQSFHCLSVIIPVYNEVALLRDVLRRVDAVPLKKELIVIDDCSTDGTRDILQSIEKEGLFPSMKVIYQEKNQGKGACIRRGIRQATGDLTIVQDADLEYDPTEYPKLIDPILRGEADVVYGSRFRGERQRILYFWHAFGNKLLTLLSNIFTNLNLTDMETCYKVFKTEIIKSLPLRSNRFGFEPEVTAKVAKLRCVIFEIPISYKGRTYAEGKKINWKDGIVAIYTILKFWLLDDLYEETAGLRTLRIMEGAGKYNEWLYKQVKPHLGNRVLETGSGVGNITKYLMGRDLVVATDVTDYYLNELRRAYTHSANVNVEKFDLTNQETAVRLSNNYKPNTVLSMNVVEHIKDDRTALQNMERVLEHKGRLVLLVPAHMALYSNMDKNLGHMKRYNKKELIQLLEDVGFEVEKSRYLNMIGALGWFINGRVFRRKLIPSRQIRAFDLLIMTLFIEKWIRPPFGLSVLIVARKK